VSVGTPGPGWELGSREDEFFMVESEAIKERSGVSERVLADGVMTQALDPAPAYRELDGSIPFGALGYLVDNAVAIVGRSTAGWRSGSVTNELSFATIGPLGAGPITVEARATAFTPESVLSSGIFLDPQGQPLGQATLRAVIVPGRPTMAIEPEGAEPTAFPWESELEAAPIDRAIGLGLALEWGEARMRAIPTLEWASGYGAVLGGAVCVFVHRALHYAVESVLGPGTRQVPVSLSVTFLRPVVCGDEPIELRARVTEVSRRFARAEASLLMPSGKPAVVAQSTHALHPAAKG
jgi:acyl-coenzyme A thioesterase PaaI-like protein